MAWSSIAKGWVLKSPDFLVFTDGANRETLATTAHTLSFPN